MSTNEGFASSITMPDFQRAITGGYLKSLQVFYFALGIGVLIFLLVTLFVLIQSSDVVLAGQEEFVSMLSIVHLLYAVLGYAAAAFLYRRMIARVRPGMGRVYGAEELLNVLRLASVIRLTVVEGVAFFGLVLVFIAAQAGVLHQYPIYWLNLFSTVILFVFIFRDFPTRQRIEELCERLFQSHMSGE
ncbi:MAG: hypothetical protein WBG01_08585 [Bacteroidota bacterium]